MTVNVDRWRAAWRFEAEVETMRIALLTSGQTEDEATEWLRAAVEATGTIPRKVELLPAHRFEPRDIEYDVSAGYGRHNDHPRWGEIVTRDIGDYVGRHRLERAS